MGYTHFYVACGAGARLGPYEIVAALGAGGMGEVYKARDTRLDRMVAIKVLPGDKVADPSRKIAIYPGSERAASRAESSEHCHDHTIFRTTVALTFL